MAVVDVRLWCIAYALLKATVHTAHCFSDMLIDSIISKNSASYFLNSPIQIEKSEQE